jgi:hypothetical protein
LNSIFFNNFSIVFFIDFKNDLGYLTLQHWFFIYITKIHSFIQFVFDGVTSISQLGYKSYMLTQVGSYRVFLIFFRLFFSLIFSFHILFARNWALIFFLFCFIWDYHILIYFFPSLSDNSTFDFFKIVFFSISSFNIWLIENESSCLLFFLFFLWGYFNIMPIYMGLND